MIIFYDSYCPLCMAEMRHLKKRDKTDSLTLVDIQDPQFSAEYPELDYDALNARIHAMLPSGEIITGLDVTHQAWKAVGVGWLYAPLRWPVIRIFADWFYTVFARHRYTISYLLTGKKRSCARCVPGEPNDK
ncbi:thiol-disulfide oxidoreductase DCC family protein [Alteromonas sp. A079]|uniref:thiol-disulfide oxidoreductase DCC family protein n=1 Tax=Alteromonas sp. A079 TaxID=3410268 RepID=UPI003B9F260E